ncbi:MAG: type IX secretion system membrane protein PorP/SprF [Bacteroidota bacterium]
MVKKKLIFIFLMLANTSVIVFAQQEPQFSQNMHNILIVNPGYAGSNDAICASVLYRNQWMGFTGAPKTMLLNVDGPVKFLRGGIGASVFNDELGVEKTFGVKFVYAFRMDVGPGQLGIGLQVGFLNKTLQGSKLEPYINDGSDKTIPISDINGGSTNFGFGLYYNTDILYFGLSSSQIAESSVGYSDFNYDLKRHYYIIAGYTKRITPSLELIPSVWIKADPALTPQIDVNILAMYNNQIWVGVSYRVQDAVVPMIGVKWNNIKFGYSYDVSTSSLKGYNSGSHEIMLGYCFRMPEKKSAQRYRNVRFL